MKAALELGRWLFLAPIGYLNVQCSMGKSLMAGPERAPLVRRAFDQYATGRFTKEQLLKHKSLWFDQPGRSSARIAGERRAATEPALAGIVDVTEYGTASAGASNSAPSCAASAVAEAHRQLVEDHGACDSK